MSYAYTAIDLSQLPPPDIIEQISHQQILAEALADFHQRMQADGQEITLLASDPAYKLAEVFAYREMLVRQQGNEKAQSVLLAYAEKADLDHKAAERNLKRHLISPATALTEAVWETDASLRRRVQLAPEGYTTAGSEGSYIFHGLNADPKVKDIYPFAPVDEHGDGKGICNIYVLSHDDNGTASEELQQKVEAALNRKNIRPTTDFVKVFSASVINYTVEAKLQIDDGPDSGIILETATEKLKAYVQEAHAFGDGPALSGIMAALHQPGVTKVIMMTPTADVSTSIGQVAYCTAVKVTIKGDDNE